MKKCKYKPTDINGLPKEIVESILTRLPIQDAVRTSILSRKWRNVWTKLPKLVFDDNFCKKSIIETKGKLMMAIYQILLFHSGLLNAFTLLISHLYGNSSEIDQFVLVALEKGVKYLFLCFQTYDPYKLPSSIFSYDQQLERLQLESCLFKPPPRFKGFNNLDSLVLVEVGISGNILSNMISQSPLLKRLNFKSSIICGPIDTVARNLIFLRVDCLCQSLYFKNTPKLATIEICVTYSDVKVDEIKASSQFMLCGRLPVVEELEVDYLYMQIVLSNRASKLVKYPSLLKSLSLSSVCFGLVDNVDDVSSALSLIKDSPNNQF